MSDKNFDSIKNFEVPQSWIDSALSVPQTAPRKKPIVFLHFSRYATAVASFMLVCVLSVVVFMLHDDSVVPVDKPISTQSTTVTDSTDVKKETKKDNATTATSKKGVSAQSKKPTAKSGNTEPTEKPTQKAQKPDDSKGHPKPSTQEKTESTQGTDMQGATIPTQNKTETPTTEPTEKPTQKPTQRPTQRPTQKPTVKPTQKPTQKPTNSAGGDGFNSVESVSCSDSFSVSKLVGSGKVYCSVYSSSGKLVGDSNLFSSQHLATIDYKTSSVVLVSYDPTSKGLLLSQGRYTYSFYNENGVVVAQGYLTVF